jgi:hypothetical protein
MSTLAVLALLSRGTSKAYEDLALEIAYARMYDISVLRFPPPEECIEYAPIAYVSYSESRIKRVRLSDLACMAYMIV